MRNNKKQNDNQSITKIKYHIQSLITEVKPKRLSVSDGPTFGRTK